MKTKRQSTDGSIFVGVIGGLLIAFGVLFIFLLGGVVAPGMYDMSEDIFSLWASDEVIGEAFVGNTTPVALNNSPILEDSERVYSNYTWSEYNCTAPTYAFFERADENSTCDDCGCDNATYKINVSYWDELGEEVTWTDPCTLYENQTIGSPEDDYTCDCGCDDADEPWDVAVGVYDWNATNESWDYNWTLCFNWEMYEIDYNENETEMYLTTVCNMSQLYNLTLPSCNYTNVTYYDWNTSLRCDGDETCGCEEGDDWWEDWSTQFYIERCDDWNLTNCSCDGNTTNTSICVDEDYSWYEFESYNESCEGSAGNLTVYTACNALPEDWEFTELTYCYNETNWLGEPPETPPPEYWFYSECVEEGEGEYNETDDYTMNYEDGEINITDGGDMFDGWAYFIDYDIFSETTGYAMREANAESMQTGFNVVGMVLVMVGFVLILVQFKEQVEGMFSFGRGGKI